MSGLKPFPKGVSGNPGGRPKGLERLVRDTIGGDMETIIKAQIAIAKGEKPMGYTGPLPKLSETTKAFEALLDRGYGKPRQTINSTGDLAGSKRVDYSLLTDDELDKMIEADEIAAHHAAETRDEEPDADPGSPGEDRTPPPA